MARFNVGDELLRETFETILRAVVREIEAPTPTPPSKAPELLGIPIGAVTTGRLGQLCGALESLGRVFTDPFGGMAPELSKALRRMNRGEDWRGLEE